MELREKIKERIVEVKESRLVRLQELNEMARKELLPFDAVIGELESLLDNFEEMEKSGIIVQED